MWSLKSQAAKAKNKKDKKKKQKKRVQKKRKKLTKFVLLFSTHILFAARTREFSIFFIFKKTKKVGIAERVIYPENFEK